MANAEHVVRLQRSISEWNKWREDHREIRPDLSEAVLHWTDLRVANLREAAFLYADLRYAILHSADLRATNFEKAYFLGTIFYH